jgi:hypothetical protein
MNPYPLYIKSAASGTEYGCQSIRVNGAMPLTGMLECPGMFYLPPENDRVFQVIPLGFNIRITNDSQEPKQPSFIVLS